MVIGLITALGRMTKIKCPHCGYEKAVERRPAHHRVCAKCHRQFPDPLSAKKKR